MLRSARKKKKHSALQFDLKIPRDGARHGMPGGGPRRHRPSQVAPPPRRAPEALARSSQLLQRQVTRRTTESSIAATTDGAGSTGAEHASSSSGKRRGRLSAAASGASSDAMGWNAGLAREAEMDGQWRRKDGEGPRRPLSRCLLSPPRGGEWWQGELTPTSMLRRPGRAPRNTPATSPRTPPSSPDPRIHLGNGEGPFACPFEEIFDSIWAPSV